MKRILSTIVPLILCCLLFGCGTPPPQNLAPEQRKSAVILAPKDKVWKVLISTIGMNWTIQTMDRESGLLTTKDGVVGVGYNNAGMEEFVYPPQVFMGTWNGMRMSLKILAVENEPGKTTVTINAAYAVYEDNVMHSWVQAKSNGSFENQMLAGIEKKVKE